MSFCQPRTNDLVFSFPYCWQLSWLQVVVFSFFIVFIFLSVTVINDDVVLAHHFKGETRDRLRDDG